MLFVNGRSYVAKTHPHTEHNKYDMQLNETFLIGMHASLQHASIILAVDRLYGVSCKKQLPMDEIHEIW